MRPKLIHLRTLKTYATYSFPEASCLNKTKNQPEGNTREMM